MPGKGIICIALTLLLLVWMTPIAAASTGEVYIVQPGDTLTRIAARHQVSLQELVEANHLQDPDLIRVGQRLIIPETASSAIIPVEGTVPYRVQKGDTLSRLAHRYGTTVEAIMQANELADPDHIVVGQLLSIPTTLLASDRPHLPVGPIASVWVSPGVVEQGDTLFVRVHVTTPSVNLSVDFDGLRLPLAQNGETYWTVAPIGALAEPGRSTLHLKAVVDGEATELSWPVWVVQGNYPVQHIVLPPAKGELLDPQKVKAERETLARVWAESATRPLWDGRFLTPLAPGFSITSPFGTRRSYNGGPVNSYHEGCDFAAPAGTLVVAPAAGRVVLAQPLTIRGNAVIIDHGLGVHTGYWHLSSIEVKAGQMVKPGDVLGRVGTTGLSTGAHLHWELRIDGVPVNPLVWTRRAFP